MMHPQEVKLTAANIQEWMTVATELSAKHVEALKEQATRQGVSYATSA
jgi:predicted DNA binding CopG/RHH family protein